ncbi:hypothetical protein AAFF_G00073310 [Aldrovandia affinis]|uniref:Uncharacterized protein n=1 Tax=Aldrovandia affinis TaxID=143900 RepID=A0AAD7RYD6_9TELE|nr:hypothetical protein AAFF_G00073310 [Aldrovandia affinis]
MADIYESVWQEVQGTPSLFSALCVCRRSSRAAMSKSDLPPSYDAWHVPIYDPQTGYYPQPPAYAPPAHEDQTNPATLPSGPHTVRPGDSEEYAVAGVWDSTAIRHAFIQKVYLIVAAQLLFTFSIVAVFTFVDPVRLFVIRNPGVYWASYAVFFISYIVLACCEGQRRRFPLNIIFLAIFTLAMSYLAGSMSSYNDTKTVCLAFGITVIVCFIVTVFCFQTKVDLTQCNGLFCILSAVLVFIGIISIIVLSFQYVEWLSMLYAAIGTIVFTLFLALHTQFLLGNRKLAISPEEYIFAALSIYLDIIQVFMFLLDFSSLASN